MSSFPPFAGIGPKRERVRETKTRPDLAFRSLSLLFDPHRVPFLSEHELPAKAKRETWVDDEDDPRGGSKKPKTAPANPDVPGGMSEEEAKKQAAKGVVASFPGGGNTL